MAAFSYIICSCCGRMSGWKDAGQVPPERCYSCEVRDGLCQHNLNQHLEQGVHSSQPHFNGECPPRCSETLR